LSKHLGLISWQQNKTTAFKRPIYLSNTWEQEW